MIAVTTQAALSSCRPAGLVPQQRRSSRPAPRRAAVAPRAVAAPVELLQLAADAAPGTVDAPISAIIIGELLGDTCFGTHWEG